MICLSDVRDYLKTIFPADRYYIGKLDNKPDRSVGVYTLRQSGTRICGIGQELSFEIIGVSVLIHWNSSADETERAARELFRLLETERNITINGHAVYLIELLCSEPIDIATDAKGVYERVIELKIYYERK